MARLQFHRRYVALSDAQKVLSHWQGLSLSERAALDAASKARREELIASFARCTYFRQCAWADYLNGVEQDPPVSQERAVETCRELGIDVLDEPAEA